MKTLKDIEVCFVPCDGECDWYTQSFIDGCREAAREWIKHLEKQRELHWEWINKGVGENPEFEYPEGFDGENRHGLGSIHAISDSYQEIIDWIKHFFNIEEV
jgi:hypothetical protein